MRVVPGRHRDAPTLTQKNVSAALVFLNQAMGGLRCFSHVPLMPQARMGRHPRPAKESRALSRCIELVRQTRHHKARPSPSLGSPSTPGIVSEATVRAGTSSVPGTAESTAEDARCRRPLRMRWQRYPANEQGDAGVQPFRGALLKMWIRKRLRLKLSPQRLRSPQGRASSRGAGSWTGRVRYSAPHQPASSPG